MNSNNKLHHTEQSGLFIENFSDVYFEDNKDIRNFFSDYILSVFEKRSLSKFDIAEWGIGGGHNLHILSYYANSVHGYDGSKSAIEQFQLSYQNKNNCGKYYSAVTNLCKPFKTPIQYDMIIYGFFSYVLTYSELIETKKNLLSSLKDEGYVIVFDFLSRDASSKSYREHSEVKTYKRNLRFWMDYFDEFDLIDYRLFDSRKGVEDTFKDVFKIDPDLPQNDDLWTFIAIFRKKQ